MQNPGLATDMRCRLVLYTLLYPFNLIPAAPFKNILIRLKGRVNKRFRGLHQRIQIMHILKKAGCLLLLFAGTLAKAQAPVALTLSAAEDTFLTHNYTLLAQKYQIDASKAMIKQAKLWANPSFSTTLGMGSTTNPKPFSVAGPNGQIEYSVDQLITLAGKRNRSIELARLQSDYNEAYFDELIRTLKLELRSSFYMLYYKKKTVEVMNEQIKTLTRIVDAYAEADKKGSVAHADLIRLRALQLGLKNDYATIYQDALDANKNMQQLLGIQGQIDPVIDAEDTFQFNLGEYSLNQVMDSAMVYRSDLKMANIGKNTAAANYRLQKALAVPDLHVGATYDKQGSYIPNFWGVTAGIDLPVWNRNQGNIRAAKSTVNIADVNYQQQQNQVTTEVANVYERIKVLESSYRNVDLEDFNHEYNTLFSEISRNFSKGNISLLQFIDYFNSYSDNVKNVNEYWSQRLSAYEELNYSIGKDLYK